jgi:hypothetical protein
MGLFGRNDFDNEFNFSLDATCGKELSLKF